MTTVPRRGSGPNRDRVVSSDAGRPLRPPVLCWHGFATGQVEDPHGVIVQREALVQQLRLVRRLDPASLDLDGWLAQRRRRRTGGVLLTVDDGLSSAIEIGLPEMLSAGRRPLLFVSPGHLGATSTWMSMQPDLPVANADQIASISREGVEIGVHGYEHDDLRGLDEASLLHHTLEARDAIADITGIVPRAFAYPFGSWDPRARDAVRAAGYVAGFSVHTAGGPMAITRSDVSPPDTAASLALKLMPGYRTVWRVSGRVPILRRGIRRAASRWGASHE